MNDPIPIPFLRTLYTYDPDTRRLYRANSRTMQEVGYVSTKMGKITTKVGFETPAGRRVFKTCGTVAFALHHGRWPRNTGAEKAQARALHDPTGLIKRFELRLAQESKLKESGALKPEQKRKKPPIDFTGQEIPQELIPDRRYRRS